MQKDPVGKKSLLNVNNFSIGLFSCTVLAAIWEGCFICDIWNELLLSISTSLYNTLSEWLYPYFTKEITILCMCETKHLQQF